MSDNRSIVQYLNADSVQNNIRSVLRDRAPQFVASVTSLVNSNYQLQNVDRKSVLSACLVAATLDLPINPNLGFAWIIPYGGKAQFQMGYKGFIQLAQRSNQFQILNTLDVREGEIEKIDLVAGEFIWSKEFLNADLKYLESRKDKELMGYLAYMKLSNGFNKQLYMSVDDLKQHATKYSQSYKNKKSSTNIWRDDFDKMAKKTVIKLMLSKYAPMNTEMQKALEADQAVVSDNGYEYPDNTVPTDDDLAEEKERQRLINFINNAKTVKELDKCEDAVNEFPGTELVDLFINKKQELKNEIKK